MLNGLKAESHQDCKLNISRYYLIRHSVGLNVLNLKENDFKSVSLNSNFLDKGNVNKNVYVILYLIKVQ